MKIVFVYSLTGYFSIEQPFHSFAQIPYGISFVSTLCQKKGYDTSIYVCVDHKKSINNFIDFIKLKKPDILAVTAVSSQYEFIKKITFLAKKTIPTIRTIIGGVHVTLNPEETTSESCFDALCIGEGENAIFDFLHYNSPDINKHNISNLWIKNSGASDFTKHPQGQFIQNIDNLPLIDRSLWDQWIKDKNDMHSILVGRGCPHKCTYCSNHILCKTGTGKYVRFRSPSNVIKEIIYIRQRYPSVSKIHLEIETLSVNLVYAKQLCIAITAFNNKLDAPLSFSTNLSLNKKLINDNDILPLFKSAGIDTINIGLESGSIKIREQVLKRPKYTNEEIIALCNDAALIGLNICLFAMIGLPGETYDDYKKTVECIRKCNPDNVYFGIYYPYQGTELYDISKNSGHLDNQIKNQEMERKITVLNLPGFTKNQIRREYILFPFKIYYGRKNIIKISKEMICAYIDTGTTLTKVHREWKKIKSIRNNQKS